MDPQIASQCNVTSGRCANFACVCAFNYFSSNQVSATDLEIIQFVFRDRAQHPQLIESSVKLLHGDLDTGANFTSVLACKELSSSWCRQTFRYTICNLKLTSRIRKAGVVRAGYNDNIRLHYYALLLIGMVQLEYSYCREIEVTSSWLQYTHSWKYHTQVILNQSVPDFFIAATRREFSCFNFSCSARIVAES